MATQSPGEGRAASETEKAARNAVAEGSHEQQAALVSAFLGEDAVEHVEDLQVPEAPQDTAQVAEQVPAPDQELNLDPELPEDFAADLEDEVELEELEDEDEPEMGYAESDEEDEDEYVDEAVLRERKRAEKLAKENAYMKKQKLTSDRKAWEEKDAPFFPLADAKALAEKASSRREFRRLIKAEHERMKPIVARLVAEREVKIKAEVEQTKQDVAAAWGKPTSGPSIPSDAQEQIDAIQKARETGDLVEVVKARMGF